MNKTSSSELRVKPDLKWVWQKLSRIVAFGLGSGLLRPARGTWGTLAAWWAWAWVGQIPEAIMGGFLALMFVLGVWACDQVAKDLGTVDFGGVVWDEIVAFWLVLWFVPDNIFAQAFAFLIFRLLDIWKPGPIAYVEKKFNNGFGVMLDDLVAAGLTILLFALFYRVF